MYKLEYYLKNEYKNSYFSKHFKTYGRALKAAIRSLKENKLTNTRLVIRDDLNHILARLVYDFVGNFVTIYETDNIGRPEKTTILYNN
jgi:hypothetical protein